MGRQYDNVDSVNSKGAQEQGLVRLTDRLPSCHKHGYVHKLARNAMTLNEAASSWGKDACPGVAQAILTLGLNEASWPRWRLHCCRLHKAAARALGWDSGILEGD